MSKTHTGNKVFTTSFNVQTTRPLDDRLVVDSHADLTNGSIEAPYQGMVVNIKGTSELWILKTSGIAESKIKSNWELVTGSGGSGSGLSKYSIPVMTPDMVEEAVSDPSIDFDNTDDTYILVDDLNDTTSTEKDVYMNMFQDMMGAIRSLQAEVARLKNSFDYGIDSYNNTRTAKGVQLNEMSGVEETEPLWAIDPGYLSLVQDNINFNTLLDINHKFEKQGGGSIDVSVEGQLTFDNCKGVFYDGNEKDASDDKLTLKKLKDSKLITYLVTDKPTIKMTLVSIDDSTKEKEIDFESLLGGNVVNKYGFCIVISRKVEDKGFNYIYFSIINYENDNKLFEGYLNNVGELITNRYDFSERYSIKSIEFDDLTLSRMKFYTKFEDFSEEVISSAPSESDYKYEVAHIAIRSVRTTEMLNTVADHLKDNELIWNKETGTLHIKSDGKIYKIGSNKEDKQNDDNMTDKKIIEALNKMGIIVNAQFDEDDNIVEGSLSNIALSPISDITFINDETKRKFTFTVDTEGNLVGKDNSDETIDKFIKDLGNNAGSYDTDNYEAVRGFICDYLTRKNKKYNLVDGVNKDGDTGKNSDRLRISSFYAPITTDEVHGCTHSFIELENSSDVDIPLTGIYLHFYNPTENDGQGVVHHLALDGVIKGGSTYLIRGAKHAEFDDESAFIKVKTFDKEWYENKKPISFEQVPVKTTASGDDVADDSPVKKAYRFCLTYGLPELSATETLVELSSADKTIGDIVYGKSTYPNIIKNPRFIDSCSYSTFASVAKQTGVSNPWYCNGSKGNGITITPNSMFRLMFALDPAKQAFNGFNTKDSSRVRYNSLNDLQILNLDKEFIGYPHSKEIIKIDRYTPRASFENRNVMTDKTQLDREKPNMVTCSFGVDVYNTRCFNWISCGVFDEYLWIRKQGESSWTKFQSYTKVSSAVEEGNGAIHRKEYSVDVNNTVYARLINRFPGNGVLFTAHKCVLVFPELEDENPVKYEYVVGRPDKDGNPDLAHTNSIYTFTIYPRTYEGRVYQITDQQGFHWIEYQVWAASAEFLNKKIDEECAEINAEADEIDTYNTEAEEYNNSDPAPATPRELKTPKTRVFPILINTGDMTQSGARINEWLDYYNGGVSLFNHLEQMNCVGNNDLCPINPRQLGTGNDSDKSSSHFFHYFYCFDVKDTDNDVTNKFFNGESLIVKAHTGSIVEDTTTTEINVKENKYIPSLYYFKTKGVLYIVVNSEIPISNCQKWFGLCSADHNYVNIYTGIECKDNGNYANVDYFTPVYETLYAWLNDNKLGDDRRVVIAMHEMPFTVITRASLKKDDATTIPCTRNHPTNAGRLGSNVNQLIQNENRGIYWCSRLLEYFGCKLVIGGHKHTYALSYPIKEKYSWTKHEPDSQDSTKEIWYDSLSDPKPMLETLEDEAGTKPTNQVSWDIDLTSDEVRNEYKVTTQRSGDKGVDNDVTLNSTKTPYIPENLYNNYGKGVTNSNDFRCCTPIALTNNPKYDGFVTYSMCQATGYKLKSNKELPSQTQVFSKIIPETTYDGNSDKPNANQLYPMYSVLEFSDDYAELDVTMNRITSIFLKNGGDKFNQIEYGTKKMTREVLCTYEKEDCTSSGLIANRPSTATVDDTYFATDENKVYIYTDSGWAVENKRMYGKWLTENDKTVDGVVTKGYNTRVAEYLADPTHISDNRYLHIKF